MKNKKVIGIRLFGAVCVIMIAICMITQGTIKNEDKKPESAACIISGKTLQDICSSAKRIFDGAAAAFISRSIRFFSGALRNASVTAVSPRFILL